MRDALAHVERGNLDAEVQIHDGSELGVLQAGFNAMVAGLREREALRDLFGRHVGDRRGELGARARRRARRRAARGRGAVRRPDRLDGAGRGARAGRGRRRCSTATSASSSRSRTTHGGWVNKFEGDGALCVFGAPQRHGRPGRLRAARRARDWTSACVAELPELRAAIGVSAGTRRRRQRRHRERFEYTVIGDPVNEAARLTQLAKDDRRPRARVRAARSTASPSAASNGAGAPTAKRPSEVAQSQPAWSSPWRQAQHRSAQR